MSYQLYSNWILPKAPWQIFPSARAKLWFSLWIHHWSPSGLAAMLILNGRGGDIHPVRNWLRYGLGCETRGGNLCLFHIQALWELKWLTTGNSNRGLRGSRANPLSKVTLRGGAGHGFFSWFCNTILLECMWHGTMALAPKRDAGPALTLACFTCLIFTFHSCPASATPH